MSTWNIGPGTGGRARVLIALGLVTIGGVGCATQPPAYYEYLEPPTAPVQLPPRIVEESPAVTQARLVAGLEGTPFEITAVDPENRFVVAHYHGEPGPYVDCGTLLEVPQKRGPRVTRRTPAAASSSAITTRSGTWRRDMRLDGRLVARLDPTEQGTALETDATYVVSKLVRKPGSEDVSRETIAFPSGDRAAFARGTTCQPTGAFEEIALAALERAADLPVELAPAAGPAEEEVADEQVAARPPADPELPAIMRGRLPVTVEALPAPAPPVPEPDPALRDLMISAVPEGSCGAVEAARVGTDRVLVEGVASDLFAMDSMINAIDFRYPELTIDNRIEVLPPGACEAFRLAEREGGDLNAGARLEVLDLRDGQLEQGEALRLALGLPEDRSHVHLSYFRSDGTVSHVELETPLEVGPDAPWLVDTHQVVAPPYGREFVLAVATDGPLFEEPRPASEPASAFLPALERALENGSDVAMTACAILTTTETRTATPSEAPAIGDPCAPATRITPAAGPSGST